MAAKVPETTTTKKDTRAGRTLTAELQAIVTRLQTDVEVPKTSVVGGDFLDVAQDIEHQELARLSASRLTERARRLRVALTRVSSGEYGVCAECGAAIPPKRLLAVPEATTCVPCQERLERGRAAVA